MSLGSASISFPDGFLPPIPLEREKCLHASISRLKAKSSRIGKAAWEISQGIITSLPPTLRNFPHPRVEGRGTFRLGIRDGEEPDCVPASINQGRDRRARRRRRVESLSSSSEDSSL